MDETTYLPAVITAVCIVVYVLPALTAFRRGHPSRWTILVVNLLLGVTLLGWIICLCWARADLPQKAPTRRSVPRTNAYHGPTAARQDEESLLQLKALLKDGIITESEYDLMRQTPFATQGQA